MTRARGGPRALALVAGLILADSSIVTLALPEIMRELETGVAGVAWTLIAFNLALAIAALPAARVAARRPAAAMRYGLAGFAAASLACAVAPWLGVLLAGRAVQGVAGAVALVASLELLMAAGADRAVARWTLAGVIGAAIGPAVGGFLTETLSWEAVFALQAPIVVVGFMSWPRSAPARVEERPARLVSFPLAALTLLSAALTAALFLLVTMLIEGWGQSPAEAALGVTVIPLAALAALSPARRLPASSCAAAGAALVAAGLAVLGLLPASGTAWTLAPQLLVGAGIGLAVPALTGLSVPAGESVGRAAGATIASRHAGVVAGLLLLTPVFTADLDRQRAAAEQAGLADLLSAPLPLTAKIELAGALETEVDDADGRLPEPGQAFDATDIEAGTSAARSLEAELADEIDRAGTAAFARSFLVAAAFAAAAFVLLGLRSRPA